MSSKWTLFYCALWAVSCVSPQNLQDNLSSLCDVQNSTEPSCLCTQSADPYSNLPEFNVDCSGMNMKEMPPENFSVVTHLDFSKNALTKLENGEFLLEGEGLVVLVFSNNEISFIDDMYFGLVPNLIELHLDHNEIVTLNSYVFKSMSNLKILDLSFNKLKTLSEGVFGPLKNLNDLNLGHNLDLGSYLLDQINFADPPSIFGANLQLTSNLTKLNLKGLGLSKIPSTFFDRLSNDVISSDRASSGDEKTYLLKELNLADNNFKEIPQVPYTITELDLSGNKIGVLAARDLNYHALRTLKLDRMRNLTKIDRYAFYNLQSLEHLSLEHCPLLREFEDLSFGVLVDDYKLTLKTLSLKGNRIRHLNSTLSKLFDYIEAVDLSMNPWNCDCDLLWLKSHKKILKNLDDLKCVTPANLVNEKVVLADIPDCADTTMSTIQKILLPIMGVLILALVCLIGYLVYMGPFSYKSRRGIGPNSPYKNVLINEL